MYTLKLIESVRKYCAAKNVARLVLTNNLKSRLVRQIATEPVDIRGLTAKDVVLFKYERPKFFILLNIFSSVQCLFWSYLGIFLFQSIKESDVNSKGRKFWTNILLDERKYANALSFVSVFFGCSVFIGTMFYTVRSIRKIILHRGGRDVTLITYAIPGVNSQIKVPVSMISSAEYRGQAKKFIPLKIKNKYFHFLVDKTGEFQHPKLFDCTIGIKRNF